MKCDIIFEHENRLVCNLKNNVIRITHHILILLNVVKDYLNNILVLDNNSVYISYDF